LQPPKAGIAALTIAVMLAIGCASVSAKREVLQLNDQFGTLKLLFGFVRALLQSEPLAE
jgi:hypothetical protein